MIVYLIYVYELCFLGNVWYHSSNCLSFYSWVRMVQNDVDIHYELSGHTMTVDEPHIILVNHVGSWFGLGSVLSLGGIIHRPCKVVCYKKYTSQVYFVGSLLERILQEEIIVDHTLDHETKGNNMRLGIKRTLEEGMDVVMFIDAGDYTRAIRTINKRVLMEFPSTIKHLFHFKKSDVYHTCNIHGYAPTRNMDEVIRTRTTLVHDSQ